uniref:Omega/M-ectatotoxin-Et1a subunit A n=1 Tax=Ectatomma tuberculatum TaxID=39300 RepID=TX1AA_ECTTU|nr:RecName: Full=Omega/M-ectatotoxin-Et1a subunit A; Short=Omega/M-ECTX-Et1a subunit A; AltName: Full=Ectatomin subunit A; Short=EA; AltName: Full=Ectatomin-Et1 subunit A [Ectatomma tuberculatum]AAB33088.1 ectatomin A [Ectatomma tuberculatum=ants, venom, Peptide, 37 aa] [Ectatomma tuberculatum]1ECI_A Chain A, ECTATOMIN [Ectatomma tuberculatum]prf//2014243A ectatomin:SUBUNIT=A [Ectatomma tuberculatum]prf//2101192A ectatomin A [Ectatomma tuberculatum]
GVIPKKIWETVCPTVEPWAKKCSGDIATYIKRECGKL